MKIRLVEEMISFPLGYFRFIGGFPYCLYGRIPKKSIFWWYWSCYFTVINSGTLVLQLISSFLIYSVSIESISQIIWISSALVLHIWTFLHYRLLQKLSAKLFETKEKISLETFLFLVASALLIVVAQFEFDFSVNSSSLLYFLFTWILNCYYISTYLLGKRLSQRIKNIFVKQAKFKTNTSEDQNKNVLKKLASLHRLMKVFYQFIGVPFTFLTMHQLYLLIYSIYAYSVYKAYMPISTVVNASILLGFLIYIPDVPHSQVN